MKNKLLIAEPPLQVLPSLALAIGLNEAIVIQQLHYWLNNAKVGTVKEGQKWIFNTYDEWQKNFPFWSSRTIQRIFSNLEEMGLIITAQFDKASYDRTKYYRIDYDKLARFDDDNIVSIDDDKLARSLDESENTTETTSERKPAEEKPNIFKLYESQFGVLTSSIADILKTAEKDYPPEWIERAIEQAAKNNAHRWSYCEAVLRKWKLNGPDWKPAPPAPTYKQAGNRPLPGGF